MKIASLNVSGGFYIGNEDEEYLDRKKVDLIDDRLLLQIMKIINDQRIDVICFQEIITTGKVGYLKSIQENTDLKYYDFFELSECNVVKDSNCGLAIFSRTPLDSVEKRLFPNPNLCKVTEIGKKYYTYDKGYMMCSVKNENLSILTHHGFPYRRFNSCPENNKDVFEFFDKRIQDLNPDVITGDFNAENFMDLMKYIPRNYTKTINGITTVDGFKFDNILVKKNREFNTRIEKTLSDHFMVITEVL